MSGEKRRRTTKVAILGMASGHQRAPFYKHDWEVWGLNNGYLLWTDDNGKLPIHRWFELHPNSDLTRRRRPADHQERLAALTIPVYSFWPKNPWKVQHPRVYPLTKAVRVGRDYFACTFAYQIALALVEGFREIALYGTPLNGSREALIERPCVEWWLGLAEGRGVKVTVDHDQPIGLGRQRFQYGLQDQDERRAGYAFVNFQRVASQSWLLEESARILELPEAYQGRGKAER